MRLPPLAFLAFIAASPAYATPCGGVDLTADPTVKPDFAAHADDLVNAEGLLWRIEKPGVAPSYLYGTVHSTQPTPMQYAHDAATYAEKATNVATELGVLDEKVKRDLGAQMLQRSLAPDVDTWAGEIEGADAARVEAMLKGKGIVPEMAHHLKLWMLMISLALPACETEAQAKGLPMVDEFLADDAIAHKVPVVGLESIDEQMKIIADVPEDVAALQLKIAARDPAYSDGAYATLLSLYGQKRPAAVIAYLDLPSRLSDAERKSNDEMTKLLLGDRNAHMAERAQPLLDRGGAFIAVGALHLSGKGGLVELLRARGYQVSKVW
jgi:uncharacterized protein YbaP (TraB family)